MTDTPDTSATPLTFGQTFAAATLGALFVQLLFGGIALAVIYRDELGEDAPLTVGIGAGVVLFIVLFAVAGGRRGRGAGAGPQ